MPYSNEVLIIKILSNNFTINFPVYFKEEPNYLKRIIIRHEFFKVLPFLSLPNGILWTLIPYDAYTELRTSPSLSNDRWLVFGGPSRRR